MKTLNEYFTSSAKQYVYRIKVAGELPKENYDKLAAALDMFDVDNCTKPKKTPIQADPHGFPGLKNEEINIFDVTLNYPGSAEQITELAKQCGIDPAKIVVLCKDFNDSMTKELEGVEDGTRLETPEYPDQTSEQKDASDAYADSYETAAREFAGEADTDFEIAGETTPAAQYSTDTDEDKDSPLSKVKRLKIKDII